MVTLRDQSFPGPLLLNAFRSYYTSLFSRHITPSFHPTSFSVHRTTCPVLVQLHHRHSFVTAVPLSHGCSSGWRYGTRVRLDGRVPGMMCHRAVHSVGSGRFGWGRQEKIARHSRHPSPSSVRRTPSGCVIFWSGVPSEEHLPLIYQTAPPLP